MLYGQVQVCIETDFSFDSGHLVTKIFTVHDAKIWNKSALKRDFETQEEFQLMGDTAYGITRYLLPVIHLKCLCMKYWFLTLQFSVNVVHFRQLIRPFK